MRNALIVGGGAFVALVIVMGVALVAVASKAATDATKKTHDYALEVDCACSWSGAVGGSTYDGSGRRVIRFHDLAITAADVQKQDGGSEPLHLTLLDGTTVVDQAQTSAAYGIATVSGSSF